MRNWIRLLFALVLPAGLIATALDAEAGAEVELARVADLEGLLLVGYEDRIEEFKPSTAEFDAARARMETVEALGEDFAEDRFRDIVGAGRFSFLRMETDGSMTIGYVGSDRAATGTQEHPSSRPPRHLLSWERIPAKKRTTPTTSTS